jgi:hypothetical protein
MHLIVFVNERCAIECKTNDRFKIFDYEFEKTWRDREWMKSFHSDTGLWSRYTKPPTPNPS